MKVMYSGSFDPITCGHLDIIKRCSAKFDNVKVVVFDNYSKDHSFSVKERYELVKEATKDITNVEVDIATGMLVDYAKKYNIEVVIRGLRAVSDYEYEIKVASMNKFLHEGLETFFMLASPNFSFLSSSVVKEIAKLGGDIDGLVPENVKKALEKKYKGE
ncbi:MAG TPA: pantetheine-phosphate adenylyltransferase [Clostridiales bacterium]|jgi:pantetheine-phosphate adenylyltransferase|nr:pantetheine-phosphate adenylyltransferase [Clostridiales bacterium]